MNAIVTLAAPKPRLTREYKRKLRERAEEAVALLIELMDRLDGDPDLEPELSQGTGSDYWVDQDAHRRWLAIEGDDGEDVELLDGGDSMTGLELLRSLKRQNFQRVYIRRGKSRCAR